MTAATATTNQVLLPFGTLSGFGGHPSSRHLYATTKNVYADLVPIHFLGACEIGQLSIARVGDVHAVRSDVPVDEPFLVQKDDSRDHARGVEACRRL